MVIQIFYSSRYGSTKQNCEWIKERLSYLDYEVEISDITNAKINENVDFLILASGVYGGKAGKDFDEFVSNNKEILLKLKIAVLANALQKQCFDDEKKYLTIIKEHKDLNIFYQSVMLGEMIFQTMNEKDKKDMMFFYESIAKFDEEEIKRRIAPKSLLNKKEIWDIALEIDSTYKNL